MKSQEGGCKWRSICGFNELLINKSKGKIVIIFFYKVSIESSLKKEGRKDLFEFIV